MSTGEYPSNKRDTHIIGKFYVCLTMKSSFQIGDIISYLEMCSEEKVNLQKGMNYNLGNNYSVILMSHSSKFSGFFELSI